MNTVPSAWPAEWRDVRMPKERMVVANEVLSLGAVRRVIDSYNV